MEPIEINPENQDDQKEELTLEKAREILGDTQLSEPDLNKIVQKIKIFCKIAYELYASGQASQSTKPIPSQNDHLDHAA